MKKHVFLIFTVAVLFTMVDRTASGQDNRPQAFNREDFGARRNTFITTEAGLTAEEAGKFIPLENEFQMKLFEVGRDCRRLRESQNKMSDAEYTKLIECYLDTRLKEAQLEKEYYEKFKKILSPEKLYKYQQAETRFRREFVIMRRPPGPPGDRNNETNRNGNRNNNNNDNNRPRR